MKSGMSTFGSVGSCGSNALTWETSLSTGGTGGEILPRGTTRPDGR
jgi:hypothetical protein